MYPFGVFYGNMEPIRDSFKLSVFTSVSYKVNYA